jgi:hypothetical protein
LQRISPLRMPRGLGTESRFSTWSTLRGVTKTEQLQVQNWVLSSDVTLYG